MCYVVLTLLSESNHLIGRAQCSAVKATSLHMTPSRGVKLERYAVCRQNERNFALDRLALTSSIFGLCYTSMPNKINSS